MDYLENLQHLSATDKEVCMLGEWGPKDPPVRLIDANKLFLPDENSDKILVVSNGRSGGRTLALAMELLKKKVEAAPTIDPEDLRPRGRWINERMLVGGFGEKWGYDCSNCGKTVEEQSGMPNYCPNCGAKMDGGEKYV